MIKKAWSMVTTTVDAMLGSENQVHTYICMQFFVAAKIWRLEPDLYFL